MLYNQCIDTGTFLDELKIAKISPIYKKDNEELLENYKPVSTLAILKNAATCILPLSKKIL